MTSQGQEGAGADLNQTQLLFWDESAMNCPQPDKQVIETVAAFIATQPDAVSVVLSNNPLGNLLQIARKTSAVTGLPLRIAGNAILTTMGFPPYSRNS